MFKLQISGQRLDIARPAWLFARTCRIVNQAALVVYRSPQLRESSPMYQPVREFLELFEVEIHRKGMFFDADMMLAHGELTVFLTNAQPHPDDDDLSEIEWMPVDPAEMN